MDDAGAIAQRSESPTRIGEDAPSKSTQGLPCEESDALHQKTIEQVDHIDEKEAVRDHSAPVESQSSEKHAVDDHSTEPVVPSGPDTTSEPVVAVDQSKDVERDAATEDAQGPKWSIYNGRQKKAVILTVSAAALFSPLSGQIYFPALNAIARDLQVSNSLVNLTITTYLIMQGLAPSFIGTLSDDAGRRAAYIVTFVIYSAANIGLAVQNNYAALLVLRCMQSAGSSGTVALANAVVADLVTSAERGTYISWTAIAPMLGPSVGPIIGGVLAQYVNWHFIFWFLLILTAAVFLPMLAFFPETCRKIVGDGSIPPPKWIRCYTNVIMERRLVRQGRPVPAASVQKRIRFPNPLATVVLLFRKDVGFPLIYSAIVGAAFYATAALIPSQFGRIYGLNELQISLCYIPFGVGAILSALVRGRTMDARFRAHAKRLGYPLDKKRAFDLSDFPIERARLEVATPMILIGSLATIVLGWVIQYGVHIAAPLICLFFIGICVTAAMSTVGVLIVDICPGKAGTATAANNLARCWFGAASTAAVVPMIDAMGIGWTATFFGLVILAFSPGLFYIMRQGPKWRRAQRDREAAKREKKMQTAASTEGASPEKKP